MTVIRATEAPKFELPGIEFTGLASPSRGSAGLCTWRLSVASDLDSAEAHTIDEDQIFMVTAGSVRITPGGEPLGPGDAAVVPAGDPIQLVNTGGTQAEIYVAIRSGFTGTMADGTKVTPPWAQ